MHPFQTNVTVTRAVFAQNHAGGSGDDIYLFRGPNKTAVPCPTPGKGRSGSSRQSSHCLFDGGNKSLTVTLPCS